MDFFCKETISLSPGSVMMICFTMCGIGACIAHWVYVVFGDDDGYDDDED